MRYPLSDLTGKIIEACFEVHNELGPGFREIIYHSALEVAFEDKNIDYKSEKEYFVRFKGREIGTHRLDLLVENKVVLELKAVDGEIDKLFIAQTLSYLKVANVQVGLIINFGNRSLQIKRLYNKHFEESDDYAD